MYKLETVTQPYAWGSHEALARLCGRPYPTPTPEAELWIGAHPQGASVATLADGSRERLDALVARDPSHALGAAVRTRFGDRLPLLLKVLAAREPLSLQAHPDAAQARAGFEREEREGLARDAPARSYRDASHKPELLCALEPFEVLCGFRSRASLFEGLLPALAAPRVSGLFEDLARGPDELALRSLLRGLLRLPRARVGATLDALAPAAARVAADEASPFAALLRWVAPLRERYGDDPGLLVALLLEHRCLAPGEAVFLPAGRLHAYLRGVGVEVMASSDNVLRGGLTPKHVAVDELERVLRFEHTPLATVRALEHQGARVYPTEAREFELLQVPLEPGDGASYEATVLGPELLLCTQGVAALEGPSGALTLRPGEAAFVPAGALRYAARAAASQSVNEVRAVLYRARVPIDAHAREASG